MDISFCQSLPKIELHAHLNGSLSEKTLKELHMSQELIDDFLKLNKILEIGPERTLEECFELFKIAHKATNNPAAVCKATQNVIAEFFEDNIIYLELRTTPRKEPAMTKKEYIDAVIEGINISEKKLPDIRVKLILSLDRRQSIEEASETVDLAIEYSKSHPNIVRGIDVSGDPTKGSWFEDLLKKIREKTKLGVTIHCAEVPNEKEVKEILDFVPDRIGHGTCMACGLGGNHQLWKQFITQRIPVGMSGYSFFACKFLFFIFLYLF